MLASHLSNNKAIELSLIGRLLTPWMHSLEMQKWKSLIFEGAESVLARALNADMEAPTSVNPNLIYLEAVFFTLGDESLGADQEIEMIKDIKFLIMSNPLTPELLPLVDRPASILKTPWKS